MDLFLTKKPTENDLASMFLNGFPVVFCDNWESHNSSSKTDNLVVTTEYQSEFRYGLEFQQQRDFENWLLNVARELSINLGCKVLYSGGPEDSDDQSLCYIFDNGKAYLAREDMVELSEKGIGSIELIERRDELDIVKH